jgi:hypothetical protein
VGGFLQRGDELVGFVAGELATRLTLREPHWSASILEARVAGSFE